MASNSTESMDSKNQPLGMGSLFVVLMIVMLWGGNAVAVSFSVDSLPPIAVAAARFAMGSAVLFVWCLLERTSLRLPLSEVWSATICGLLLFAQISTFNVAVQMTNSTHGAMLVNTYVFFVAATEHFTGADRINVRRLVGIGLAAFVVLLVMQTRSDGNSFESFVIGDLILLLSAGLLAIRVIYVRRAVQTIPPSRCRSRSQQ